MNFTKGEIASQYFGIVLIIILSIIWYFLDQHTVNIKDLVIGILLGIAIISLFGWNKLLTDIFDKK